ncbi:uncharacterized protein LOC135463323 [Liolophura sinensis]|uniref:uncharacterized protein LOC135463323 n=1 Tax=Liolophura sinensis TaxID=3198878 RepID=UPI0031581634
MDRAEQMEQTENCIAFTEGKIFEFLDFDNDGFVSVGDLNIFPKNLIRDGKIEDGKRLSALYKELYVRICRGAGYPAEQASLTKEDWIRGKLVIKNTEWLQREFMPGIVDIYFSTVDLNQDGRIGLREWEHFYRSRGIEDKAFCVRTFQQMDTNGDGVISPDEFKNVFAQMGKGNNNYSFLYARK